MVWPSSTSICSPIGSIVTVWLITLPSVSDVLDACQPGGGDSQHALVVNALADQAGVGIRSERLAVKLPFSLQKVCFGGVWVGVGRRLDDVLNQCPEGHVRRHQ